MAQEPIIIKKYANRRLYNTDSSSYVTLETLCEMVKEGREFLVYDAKSGNDLTRSVLTQIIMEEEAKGHNLLPIRFLRQLISFYDDKMQSAVPRYLEMSLENFSKNQQEFQAAIEQALAQFTPDKSGERPKNLEELMKQNYQRFENVFKIFQGKDGEEEAEAEQAMLAAPEDEPAEIIEPNAETQAEAENTAEIDALRDQLSAMQAQLEKLSSK